MTQLLPPKKEVALALLERSNVDVYLDPRAKGVVVPPQFRKEPRLILKIGLNMPVPIPDLRLDDESMSCTLSFNRSPFYCVVPWSSVFAMVGEDGRGMVWPDDVPQELAVKVVEPGDGAHGAHSAGATGMNGVAGRIGAVAPPSGAPAATSVRAAEPSASSASASPAPAARRNGKANKLAPTDEPSAASASARGGKKKKKKEEEGVRRPVLVAVPRDRSEDDARLIQPSPASQPSHAVGRDSQRPREIRQPPEQRRPHAPQPRDGVSAIAHQPPQAGRSGPRQPAPPSQRRPPPSQRPPPADGEARPKRELPPYLRVVK